MYGGMTRVALSSVSVLSVVQLVFSLLNELEGSGGDPPSNEGSQTNETRLYSIVSEP